MNSHLIFTQFDTVLNHDLLGEAEMIWVEVSFGPTKNQTRHHRVESLHTHRLCRGTHTGNEKFLGNVIKKQGKTCCRATTINYNA